MCMNKSNLIIALFSFLPILNVIDFESKPREFIYLLPILLYTLPSAFIREKEKTDLGEGEFAPLSKIHASWGLDFVVFIILCHVMGIFVTYVFAVPSNFVVYPLYYILLMHNVLYRAVSHRLLKLHVNRNTLSEKFRLLAVNFILLFPFYFGMFGYKHHLQKPVMNGVFFFCLALSLINYIFRILVFKSQSLFERIFDIQTMMFIRKEEKIL